jgi:uncharacterized repeat protein (TIGR01451 family)
VIGQRTRRLASVTSAAVLSLLLLGVGPASASTPNWSITIVKLPPTVTLGKDAGYRVTVANAGPSNIVGLSLTDSITTPPTYFSGLSAYATGPGSCVTSPRFSCDLGTLNAFQSTTFTIAYASVNNNHGTFDVTFSIRSSSGDTGSDNKPGKPGNSRGDALDVTAHTGLNSGNFTGGYFQADQLLSTNPTLGKQNKQTTSLVGFGASSTNPYDVMISDGSTTFPTDPEDPNTGLACVGASCTGLLGEWSFVNLKEGAPQGTAFHVTMILDGSYIPGGTSEADLVLVHVYYDANGVSQTEVIGEGGVRCSSATASEDAQCIFITKVGPNWKIDAWLFHNGGLRLQ